MLASLYKMQIKLSSILYVVSLCLMGSSSLAKKGEDSKPAQQVKDKESVNSENRLKQAIEQNDLSLVLELLPQRAQDVSLNTTDSVGRTAVYRAIHRGDLDLIKLFVEMGVDASIPDNFGSYPIHLAAANKNRKLLEYLVKDLKLDVNTRNGQNETPLHIAARQGYIKHVQYLTRRGADVNVENASKHSPLYLASTGGFLRLSETLIKKGARTDIVDMMGNTLLHAASLSGSMALLVYYTQGLKMDVTAKNVHGKTPKDMAYLSSAPQEAEPPITVDYDQQLDRSFRMHNYLEKCERALLKSN